MPTGAFCKKILNGFLYCVMTYSGCGAKLGNPQALAIRVSISHSGKTSLYIMANFGKKLVRRGIYHACLQRKKEYHPVELHEKIGQLMHQVSLVPDLPSSCHQQTARDDNHHYGCMQCHRSFTTLAGESVHMCKTHSIIASERYLFDETHCPCCLREYHTHSKVLAHLRHATQCKETLRNRRLLCVPVPGQGSLKDRELAEGIDGAIPMMQSYGPLLPTPNPRVWDNHDIVFLEFIYLHLLDGPDDMTLEVYM